jgi:hypothetical protein
MAIGSKQNHRQNQLIASKSRVNRALRVNLLDHRYVSLILSLIPRITRDMRPERALC